MYCSILLTVVLADVVPLSSPAVFEQHRSYVVDCIAVCTPGNSRTPLAVLVEEKV